MRARKPEWCLVKFESKQLRLFAGRLIVLTLEGESVWVTTSEEDSAQHAELSHLPAWRWDDGLFSRYRRTPSHNGYYTPRLDEDGDWASIRIVHLAYLERALTPGVAPDHRSSAKHQLDVVRYIDAVVPESPDATADAGGGLRSQLTFDPGSIIDARDRILASIVQRQGRPAFRESLLRAYGFACAFSGCTVEEVLDAAHIISYQGPSTDHVQNGLLLRTDLHTLFDLGLLAIDSANMTILVAPPLAGTAYGDLAGRPVRLPSERDLDPSREALDEHRRRSTPID